MGCNCEHCNHEHNHAHNHEHSHARHHDHGDEHHREHNHDHGDEAQSRRIMLARIIVSALLLIASLVVPMGDTVRLVILLAAMLIVGYQVIWEAVINLLHGRMLDEMFLMTLAAVGAFALGDYAEGVAVMLLFQIGEMFQDYAVDKSRDSIAELMDIRPEYANVEKDGQLVRLLPEGVEIGRVIVIRPGEKVPLDGEVLEGYSALNTVALTGESAPRDVKPGDTVISGCVNMQGTLRVRVTSLFADSTVSRILTLVEKSSDHKSKADRFITRFARVYTPIVVGLAVVVALIPPLFTGEWAEWLHRALSFLVISCPCALVISVPLSFFSGIGGASRRGILMKGANYMEMLADCGTVVMDKTGTLTQGVFKVTHTEAVGMPPERLLALAAAAEGFSTHPIALSLREAAGEQLCAETAEEIAGHGVIAQVEGRRVAVGNEKLMAREQAACSPVKRAGTVVHVAVDGTYAGYILITDTVKSGAKEAIARLKSLGVQKVVMLTGDSESVAREVAQEVGVDEVHASLLPDGKVAQVERLLDARQKGETLAFVGDGINDAPVLARADVGIAMGAMGADAAIEAADVVLMDDDLRKLADAIRISRATHRIVRENIVFSLAVKALIMVLAIVGMDSLWCAVFADVGVCFLAILNAMRAMHLARK